MIKKFPVARLWVFQILLLIFPVSVLLAQDGELGSIDEFEQKYHNWYNFDARKDKVAGVSVNKAYEEILKGKEPAKKIVVAVIDSGTDIDHGDLEGRIWLNEDEVPGNNSDDDENGFIDDRHGWGFLGNADGENIGFENFEYVRIVRDLDSLYADVRGIEELPKKQHEEYQTYLLAKQNYEEALAEHKADKENIEAFEKVVILCENILREYLEDEPLTAENIRKITPADEGAKNAKKWLLEKYDQGFTKESLTDFKKHNNDYLQYHLNIGLNARTISADNPKEINDRDYGNSNVMGPEADHGTAVAGLIAGVRGNGLGIEGIAENVEIMALRAVPNGDEYDKDVALAIRYAVDNGAHIINMSFGKDFSPQKHFVDEAVMYAAENNVLLVHAAGNDGENIDEVPNFPTKNLNNGTVAANWLEVGATSMTLDKHFSASFSNYGSKTVDLFAPGVDIVSLVPGNKYNQMNGTSFASPVVAGVAALVWSHYPQFSAVEIKEILLESSTKYPRLKVYVPGKSEKEKEKVKFSKLSASGGVVNAYEALRLAEKLAEKKSRSQL